MADAKQFMLDSDSNWLIIKFQFESVFETSSELESASKPEFHYIAIIYVP